MIFVSWIPTVTGYLSFQNARKPRVNQLFLSDMNSPWLRSVFTSALPFNMGKKIRCFIENKFKGMKTNFYFVWIPSDAPLCSGKGISGAVHILDNYPLDRTNPEDFCNFKPSVSDPFASVEIYRNGACKIEIKRSACNDDKLYYCQSYGTDLDCDLSKVIYNFLRDMLHTHYHHSSYTDSIIGVFALDDNVHNWKKNAFNNLMRKIHYRRKSKHVFDLNDALGMLQYAKSFASIFFTREINFVSKKEEISVTKNSELVSDKYPLDIEYPDWAQPSDDDYVSGFGFGNLENSIVYSLPKSESISNTKSAIFAFWNFHFGPILTVFALLIAAGGLLQLYGESIEDLLIYNKRDTSLVSSFWLVIIKYISLNPRSIILSFTAYLSFFTVMIFISRGLSYGLKGYSSSFVREHIRMSLAKYNGMKRNMLIYFLSIALMFAMVFIITAYILFK